MSRRAHHTGLPCTGVFCKTKCPVPRLFRLGKGSLDGVPLFETGNEYREWGREDKERNALWHCPSPIHKPPQSLSLQIFPITEENWEDHKMLQLISIQMWNVWSCLWLGKITREHIVMNKWYLDIRDVSSSKNIWHIQQPQVSINLQVAFSFPYIFKEVWFFYPGIARWLSNTPKVNICFNFHACICGMCGTQFAIWVYPIFSQ